MTTPIVHMYANLIIGVFIIAVAGFRGETALIFLLIALTFGAIDIDHTNQKLDSECMYKIKENCSTGSRGIFHTRIFFYMTLAFLLSLTTHFYMDGIIDKIIP